MKTYKVRLLSPEGVLKEGEIDLAVLPSTGGQVSILANHEPYLTPLKEGIISLSLNGQAEPYLITSGFAKFENNLLTLTCETALKSEGEIEAEVKKTLELSSQRNHEILSAEEQALLEGRLRRNLEDLHLKRKLKPYQR